LLRSHSEFQTPFNWSTVEAAAPSEQRKSAVANSIQRPLSPSPAKSGLFPAFRADRGFAASSADAFRLSVPALGGAAAYSSAGAPIRRPRLAQLKNDGGKHAPAARLLGGSIQRFPLIHQAQSATDQVSG
jgi:hypothetical protein